VSAAWLIEATSIRATGRWLSWFDFCDFRAVLWQAIKDQNLQNQNVGLAHGFLDIPDAGAVGRQHQCVAGLYVQGFAAVGVKVQRPWMKWQNSWDDLPPPAPGRAFPDAGFDAVVALDAGGRGDGDRLAQGTATGLTPADGCRCS
jgi:hypothetical protein